MSSWEEETKTMNAEQQSESPEQENPSPSSSQPPSVLDSGRTQTRRKLMLVIAGVVIILVSVVCWLFFARQVGQSSNRQNSAVADDQKAAATSLEPQPEDVTGKIHETYAAQYTLLDLDENNQPKVGELSVRLSKSSPAYKVDGYNFYTDYDGGSSFSVLTSTVTSNTVLPQQADTALRTTIAGIYKDFGLVRTGAYAGGTIDVYTGEGLICTIEIPTAPTSSNTASCGLIDFYKAAAEKAKPFADALPDVDPSLYLGQPKIVDSPVRGYQRASVGRGSIEGDGSIALFYKKDSGLWTYFTSVQDGLLCSSYDTVDLRNAFKGEACYGPDSTMKTVE